MPIYIENDNVVVIEGLYDPWASAGAGAYIASGTVTAQIYDGDGDAVGGSITLTYYTARAGVAGHWWVGSIEEDVAGLAALIGQDVSVVYSIAASSDRVGKLTRRERVLDRTS